jgi:Transglutaminase elicitor
MKSKVLLLIPLLFSQAFASDNYLPEYDYNYGEYVEQLFLADKSGPLRPTGSPFNSVTAKFGNLEVELGDFNIEAKQKPWSSWWYPLFDKLLFEDRDGGLSPLSKYDAFAKKSFRQRTQAREFEETKLYDPRAVGWAGLCDAWSMAAILEKEPVKPVTKNGITFNVVDLKGLLLKTYEGSYLTDIYGQRNNAQWDSVYEDVYPEEFHKFLQKELYEKRNAFIMDFDSGIQVWNVPVYKAKMKITKDDQNSKVLHVKLFLSFPSQFIEDYNFTGTEEMLKSYTYDLYGSWNSNGKFVVDYGLWIESSRWDHPDYLIAVPQKIERKSRNTEIDPKIVDAILEGSR